MGRFKAKAPQGAFLISAGNLVFCQALLLLRLPTRQLNANSMVVIVSFVLH